MNKETTLQWNAGFDRRYISTTDRCVRYLVVEVTAPSLPVQEKATPLPLNLGLVIDASGSMRARDAGHADQPTRHGHGLSRLGAAQQASEGVVAQLDGQDALSLVSFADEAITHLARLPLNEASKQTALAAIAGPTTRGRTNLHDGWLEGAEQVATFMAEQPSGRNRLLLLSDGHANCGVIDPQVLGEIAAGLRQRGISSSTVGIVQRVVRPMAEDARKEISTAMYKRARGALDYRSAAPKDWEAYLED